MAEQSSPAGRKLMVEICNANNLMPKNGQGTASAFVVVDFDGQRRRTKTIARDLNPQWDEKLEFVVHHVTEDSVASDVLELNVYNEKMIGKRSNFLGKAKIAGTSFSKAGSESLVYYPLEKRSVFSQVKGEIGIKVWYEDPVPPPEPETASTPTNSADPSSKSAAPEAEVESQAAAEEKEKPAPEEDKEKEEDQNKKKSTTEEAKKHDLETKKEGEASSTASESAETPAEATPSSSPPPAAEVANPPIAQTAEKIREEKPKESNLKHARSSAEMDLRSLSRVRCRGGYDLVDRMPFLYVRVVKAKRLANPDRDSSSVLFAKLVIGTHSVKTKSQSDDKDWDQVFAFDKEGLNSTSLEISVWTAEKKAADGSVESCLGTVMFDLQEVPKRVPPDSPLAPQWYTLEGICTGKEGTASTEVMVVVWVGTQADEAFQESWQSDSGGFIPETRAKVYLSPKLWYLRLTVIQTQDLQLGTPQAKARGPELYVKGQLGAQLFKTCRATPASPTTAASNNNPTWNEDLVFVAAEPFEPFLVVTVVDGTNGKPVGYVKIQVAGIERRTDDWVEPKSRWFNLIGSSDDQKEKPYAGRIHMRVCLEGGYHVLDEAAHVTSDVQASAKQLGKAPIGLLEVGIRGASNLLPVKTKDGTRGTTDAYVVAKYGPKWVRTRTILDRFNPRWNEQYAWDVYDPCTVLTIGIFDNGRYYDDNDYNCKQEDINVSSPGGKAAATGRRDIRIGKLRIRLSTLDINRVHLNNHPLTVLLPGGAKRMGEIEIAIRFTCSSWISLIQAYSNPMLPRMHYIRPLGPARQDILRHTAMQIVAARLARSEPALGQEVVQFVLDTDCHVWSMRKSKVNWFRVVGGLSKLAMVTRWIDGIRKWVHTPTTVLVHVILVAVVLCPHLVLPTIFMYAFMILALRVRYRQKIPIGVDPRLSYVGVVSPDELDEELDGFPSTRPVEVVRMRYDRLRALAGRAQTFLGDIAAQWERMEALYNWRDPRATGIFVVFCFMASLLFYVVPFGAFVLGLGFYYMRHPRFRGDMPSVPANFFRRLPSLSDQIL